MQANEKRLKVRKYFFILLVAFVAVFAVRWAYELFFSSNDIVISYSSSDNRYLYTPEPTNIASSQLKQTGNLGQVVMIDQKYEKTAVVSSYSNNFTESNAKVRGIIDKHEAVIQSETLTGLDGSQMLKMAIGVIPERFDDLVAEVRGIGELTDFAVNKVDKTSEYRTLMAEIETLQKTLESYRALKERGGDIQDSLLLEDKIIEVERSLQELGVSIGQFSTENSFCTINFTLRESAYARLSVRFALTCAKNSFFWTVSVFALVIALALAALGCVYIFVMLTSGIRGPSRAKTPEGHADVATAGEDNVGGQEDNTNSPSK